MALKLEYASSSPRRRRHWRTVGRVVAICFAAIAFAWSLLIQPHLILSNHGVPETNEWFSVRVLVDDPTSRSEFRDYHIRSFAGFHFVNWAQWHRDGFYVLIPKWVIILLIGSILVVAIAAMRRGKRDTSDPNS